MLQTLQTDDEQLRKYFIPQREIDNVALWKQYRDDVCAIKADGDHMTMLHQECVDSYVDYIFTSLEQQ